MSRTVRLEWLLENYQPGSRGHDHTWDDEERELHEFRCICNSPTIDGITRPDLAGDGCGIPGHYQKMLEDEIRKSGRIDSPVLLGNDGRIWDGHHRIVAARRLGIADIPVED